MVGRRLFNRWSPKHFRMFLTHHRSRVQKFSVTESVNSSENILISLITRPACDSKYCLWFSRTMLPNRVWNSFEIMCDVWIYVHENACVTCINTQNIRTHNMSLTFTHRSFDITSSCFVSHQFLLVFRILLFAWQCLRCGWNVCSVFCHRSE